MQHFPAPAWGLRNGGDGRRLGTSGREVGEIYFELIYALCAKECQVNRASNRIRS